MNIEDIVKIMEEMNKHGMDAVTYAHGDEKISIKKNMHTNTVTTMQPMPHVEVTDVQKPTDQSTEISGNVVTSPLVGTFYAAPSPDAKPYVQVGDTVKKGQVIGIIEAMKLMNEVESDYDGVVREILVSDKSTIEFGQPMFVIG